MIPVSFDPLGVGGSPSYDELSDFQAYVNNTWTEDDPKKTPTVLINPVRWHSNDPDPSHWGVRIVIYIQQLNQTRPIDLAVSYSGDWLTQPTAPSLQGQPVAFFLHHNGTNILA